MVLCSEPCDHRPAASLYSHLLMKWCDGTDCPHPESCEGWWWVKAHQGPLAGVPDCASPRGLDSLHISFCCCMYWLLNMFVSAISELSSITYLRSSAWNIQLRKGDTQVWCACDVSRIKKTPGMEVKNWLKRLDAIRERAYFLAIFVRIQYIQAISKVSLGFKSRLHSHCAWFSMNISHQQIWAYSLKLRALLYIHIYLPLISVNH